MFVSNFFLGSISIREDNSFIDDHYLGLMYFLHETLKVHSVKENVFGTSKNCKADVYIYKNKMVVK
jgi:hypothetical protein